MPLLEGRNISASEANVILINQAMEDRMGWFGESILKEFQVGQNAVFHQVVGVVADAFFVNTKGEEIEPLIIMQLDQYDQFKCLNIKLAEQDTSQVVPAIKNQLNGIIGNGTYRARYLKDRLDQYYNTN
jgi:hypothetical protein